VSTADDCTNAVTDTPKPGRCRWRAASALLLALAVPPAANATAFQLQPSHLVLDIAVPYGPTGYFWWETQRSQLAYADSWGVLYVHRRVGSTLPSIDGWNRAEEVFAYFDRWLTGNGWTYAGPSFDTDPELPGGRLLARASVGSITGPPIATLIRSWRSGRLAGLPAIASVSW
jgi:hypothetical protein